MKTKIVLNLKTISSILFFILSYQLYSQIEYKEVFFEAMKDEMQRNIESLSYEDFDPPFYISYTIGDIKVYNAKASLGALYYSLEDVSRNWSARVMVGNYEINDENFTEHPRYRSNDIEYFNIPLENDYNGIRRSLWISANNIYKSAASKYKNKIEAIEKNNLQKSVLEIQDFCKVPIIKKNIESADFPYSKHHWDSILRVVSSAFIKYNWIRNSEMELNFYQARIYFMNTEGIKTSVPIQLASLKIYAQTLSETGDHISDYIVYHAKTPKDLPTIDKLVEHVDKLANLLNQLKTASKLYEGYNGPVIISDCISGKFFMKELFGGKDNLKAFRESLQNKPESSFSYGKSFNSFENKMNKKVYPREFTIVTNSKLNSYNKIKLIGDFSIDAEGVEPPEEMVLVENGVLKALLNDRTPTRNVPNSNGHKRYGIVNNGFSHAVGPGNLFVKSNKGLSYDSLLIKAINIAKEEDLEYILVAKAPILHNCQSPVCFYKHYINTGEEELIRGIGSQNIITNNLKNVAGVSKEQYIYNALESFYAYEVVENGSYYNLRRGIPVSFIVPSNVLIDNIEIDIENKPIYVKLPVVSPPTE
ncbi:MAG: hypothetical protein KAT68_15060 [Bacteroidales bacterium]|nr:hypothetical protein [Bacteroidales bacterium]